MSSGQSKFVLWTVSPSNDFVIGDMVGEAAVQDADEAVAEGPQGLVVGVAGGAALVVAGAGAGGWR